MNIRRALLLALLPLLCPLLAHAATIGSTISGRVVAVHDGDTITLLSRTTQHRIRLADIDAPERPGQPFSEASRKALAAMIANRDVTVQIMDIDSYKRPVGRVYLGPVNVNRELVRAGLAWCNTRYNRDIELPRLEQNARAARLGLWRDPQPVPPWVWRKQSRKFPAGLGFHRHLQDWSVSLAIRPSRRAFDTAHLQAAPRPDPLRPAPGSLNGSHRATRRLFV